MDEPHSAIESHGQGQIVNLTDRRAEASRKAQLELLGSSAGPDAVLRALRPALAALRRLDQQARLAEAKATGPSLDAYLAEEQRRSHEYGGRTVFGPAEPPAKPVRHEPPAARAPARKGQLGLPGLD